MFKDRKPLIVRPKWALKLFRLIIANWKHIIYKVHFCVSFWISWCHFHDFGTVFAKLWSEMTLLKLANNYWRISASLQMFWTNTETAVAQVTFCFENPRNIFWLWSKCGKFQAFVLVSKPSNFPAVQNKRNFNKFSEMFSSIFVHLPAEYFTGVKRKRRKTEYGLFFAVVEIILELFIIHSTMLSSLLVLPVIWIIYAKSFIH